MARDEERHRAKLMYVEDGLKELEISARLNVPVKTIYRWAKEDKWDDERKALGQTSVNIIKNMLGAAVESMQKITEDVKANGIEALDSQKLFALTNLIKEAKKLLKDQDKLGDLLLMAREYTEFMQARDQELLKRNIPLLREFAEEMKKKYGRRN
jgi:hypothetical protein